VRTLNVSRLLGAGILHTKFIIADNQSFYVGSANMDWRSLTQARKIIYKFLSSSLTNRINACVTANLILLFFLKSKKLHV